MQLSLLERKRVECIPSASARPAVHAKSKSNKRQRVRRTHSTCAAQRSRSVSRLRIHERQLFRSSRSVVHLGDAPPSHHPGSAARPPVRCRFGRAMVRPPIAQPGASRLVCASWDYVPPTLSPQPAAAGTRLVSRMLGGVPLPTADTASYSTRASTMRVSCSIPAVKAATRGLPIESAVHSRISLPAFGSRTRDAKYYFGHAVNFHSPIVSGKGGKSPVYVHWSFEAGATYILNSFFGILWVLEVPWRNFKANRRVLYETHKTPTIELGSGNAVVGMFPGQFLFRALPQKAQLGRQFLHRLRKVFIGYS